MQESNGLLRGRGKAELGADPPGQRREPGLDVAAVFGSDPAGQCVTCAMAVRIIVSLVVIRDVADGGAVRGGDRPLRAGHRDPPRDW